jgi:hypothetical protein
MNLQDACELKSLESQVQEAIRHVRDEILSRAKDIFSFISIKRC